jgi:hypothetical protein
MLHNGLSEGDHLLARRIPRAVALVLSVGLAACVKIDGGAIELSWVTYCSGGKRPDATQCSCNARAAALARVQLVVVGVSDGAVASACAGRSGCEFEAAHQQGTTGFFVPPGDYDISLVPLDASGTALGGPDCPLDSGTGCIATPPPIRRTLTAGEVVSLGTLELGVPDCPVVSACPNAGGGADGGTCAAAP